MEYYFFQLYVHFCTLKILNIFIPFFILKKPKLLKLYFVFYLKSYLKQNNIFRFLNDTSVILIKDKDYITSEIIKTMRKESISPQTAITVSLTIIQCMGVRQAIKCLAVSLRGKFWIQKFHLKKIFKVGFKIH